MCAAVVSGVNSSPVLEPAELFSILWRLLSSAGSCGMTTLRFVGDGMQAVILRAAKAPRN